MAWPGVKTWGAGPWQFSDANTYIRDAMISVRRYQTATHAYGGSGTATTSLSTFGAHANLCSTTPDEITRLVVMLLGNFTPSTTMDLSVAIRDQSGTPIQELAPTKSFYGTSGANYPFCMGGTITVPAGTNPGFDLRFGTSIGTAALYWTAIAMVAPAT